MEYITYEKIETKLKGIEYNHSQERIVIDGAFTSSRHNFTFGKFPGVLISIELFTFIKGRQPGKELAEDEIGKRAAFLAFDYVCDIERAGGLVAGADGIYQIPANLIDGCNTNGNVATIVRDDALDYFKLGGRERYETHLELKALTC